MPTADPTRGNGHKPNFRSGPEHRDLNRRCRWCHIAADQFYCSVPKVGYTCVVFIDFNVFHAPSHSRHPLGVSSLGLTFGIVWGIAVSGQRPSTICWTEPPGARLKAQAGKRLTWPVVISRRARACESGGSCRNRWLVGSARRGSGRLWSCRTRVGLGGQARAPD